MTVEWWTRTEVMFDFSRNATDSITISIFYNISCLWSDE